MKKTLIRAGIAAVAAAALALPLTALAAAPKKGGLYVGDFPATATRLAKTIKLQVRPDGKTARVAWICGTGRGPTYLSFPLKADGTFKGVAKTGSLLVWYIQGRFISATQARIFLSLNAACDARGIHGVLTLKP